MMEYKSLVKRVATKYSNGILGGKYSKNEPFVLRWCEECKEINLWTYWQGRNNPEHKADILLIGQDWASPWETKNGSLREDVIDILKSEKGCSGRYIKSVDNNSFPTDVMLVKLFCSLGPEYDPYIEDNDKLFFTNLCLGYRNYGASGGLYMRCLNEDVPFIEELIKIVEPKLIICLGKDTYEAFVKKTQSVPASPEKNFYRRFIGGMNYAIYDGNIPVYGQAHPGALGASNRKRYNNDPKSDNKSGEDLMFEDWAHMKKWLK